VEAEAEKLMRGARERREAESPEKNEMGCRGISMTESPGNPGPCPKVITEQKPSSQSFRAGWYRIAANRDFCPVADLDMDVRPMAEAAFRTMTAKGGGSASCAIQHRRRLEVAEGIKKRRFFSNTPP